MYVEVIRLGLAPFSYPISCLQRVMSQTEIAARARRFDVRWPVKVRRLDESTWDAASSLNISTSGILIETPLSYGVGDRVELEISFLGNTDGNTIVGTFGHVVRHHTAPLPPRGTAVKFDVPTLAAPFSKCADS